MTTEERVRLVLELIGQGDFEKAATATRGLASEIRKAGEAAAAARPEIYDLYENTYKLVEQAQTSVTSATGAMTTSIRQATEAKRMFASAASDAAGNTRNTGMAVLEASRAFEDLQFGIRGVLNNIPLLLQSLGAGAGLAGVVSLVAVGLDVLYRNWDKIANAWAGGETQNEAERMAKYAESIGVAKDKLDEFAKAKEADRQAQQKFAQTPEPSLKTEGDRVKEAVDTMGGKDAVEAIMKARVERFGPGVGLDQATNRAEAERLLLEATKPTGQQERRDLQMFMERTGLGDTKFGELMKPGGLPSEQKAAEEKRQQAFEKERALNEEMERRKEAEKKAIEGPIRQQAEDARRRQEQAAREEERAQEKAAREDEQAQNRMNQAMEQNAQRLQREDQALAKQFGTLFNEALAQTGNVEQARMMAMQQLIINQQEIAAQQAQWQAAYRALFNQARNATRQNRGGGF